MPTSVVSFVLNGVPTKIDSPNPSLTLLNWLRYEKALTGTKEGCAEGDCGACTVVLGELKAGKVRYRAVNACILFVANLTGVEVITVDALGDPRFGLHPIQQAMAETHASQCGFCTPGFVMSLAAHEAEGGETDENTIANVVAGNLCRCTGYGPILKAAAAAKAFNGPNVLNDHHEARGDILEMIAHDDRVEIEHKDPVSGIERRFFAPATLDDFADLALAWPDATILAGGTDVGLWITKQDRKLDAVISLARVEGLQRVEEFETELLIGAGVTYTAAFDYLAKLSPDLEELLRRLGSVQVRNAGTIGGNIANGSPIGDSMPALIALGASIVLRMGENAREIPLEDYFIDYGKQDRMPGEILTHIRVPKPETQTKFAAYKISKRFDQDITASLGAFAIEHDGGSISAARIAFGGMAATPKRATALEAALKGAAINDKTLAKAKTALAADFQPISDMRASASYRQTVAANMIEKLFIALQEPEMANRVTSNGVHASREAQNG